MTDAEPEPIKPRIPFTHNVSSVHIVLRSLLIGTGAILFSLSGCAQHSDHPPPAPPPSALASKTLNGTYTLFSDGRQQAVNGQPRPGGVPSTTTWRITPCGHACARVTSSLKWTTELHLIQNTWQATRKLDIDCGAGPSTITYAIEADTLTGTLSNYIPRGTFPSVVVEPAKLTNN